MLSAIQRKFLHSRVANSYFLMVGLFTLLSAGLVLAIFMIAQTTPDLVRQDYGSISAARKMKHALLGLRHPEDFDGYNEEKYMKLFDEGLAAGIATADMEVEKTSMNRVAEIWKEVKGNPRALNTSKFRRFYKELNFFVAQNENQMSTRIARSDRIRWIAGWGGIVFFVLVWFV